MFDAAKVGTRRTPVCTGRHVRRMAASSRRTLITRFVGVLVLLAGLLPAALVGSASAKVKPSCPDVVLIGARGSGEPETHRGLGPEVGPLSETLAKDLDGKLTYKSLLVVYPAASAEPLRRLSKSEQALLRVALSPGPAAPAALAGFLTIYKVNHLNPFLASINAGITSALDELRTEAVQCPMPGSSWPAIRKARW
jgi:hypothetical protein